MVNLKLTNRAPLSVGNGHEKGAPRSLNNRISDSLVWAQTKSR